MLLRFETAGHGNIQYSRIGDSQQLLRTLYVMSQDTRISVQHVATLLRKGVAEREIREDFPALEDGDLTYARLVARTMTPQASPGRLQVQQRGKH